MGPGDEGLSKKTGVQSKPKEDSEADEINGFVINHFSQGHRPSFTGVRPHPGRQRDENGKPGCPRLA